MYLNSLSLSLSNFLFFPVEYDPDDTSCRFLLADAPWRKLQIIRGLRYWVYFFPPIVTPGLVLVVLCGLFV